MQNENAIQTINLTKTFKSKTPTGDNGFFNRRKTVAVNAIDNLNLAIKKGELFGLLGPNGAGKTTLVKMLCTLLPPDKGTALINGYDIVKQQMEVKRSLGTLFSVGERGFLLETQRLPQPGILRCNLQCAKAKTARNASWKC